MFNKLFQTLRDIAQEPNSQPPAMPEIIPAPLLVKDPTVRQLEKHIAELQEHADNGWKRAVEAWNSGRKAFEENEQRKRRIDAALNEARDFLFSHPGF